MRCEAAYSLATDTETDDREFPSPAALVLTCELPPGHKTPHMSGAFTWTRYEAVS